jgi:CBS domain-containing protein
MLRGYHQIAGQGSEEEVGSAVTSAIIDRQKSGLPVHEWKLASLDDLIDWKPSEMLVEESMTKDIFTVHKDDIVQLVAEMMDWKKLRYVLVEDGKGKLLGLVSSRKLLREYSEVVHNDKKLGKSVKEVMVSKLLTINPEARLTEAMEIMRKHQIGCLPVVTKNEKLVGIITEQTFLDISARLLKRLSSQKS